MSAMALHGMFRSGCWVLFRGLQALDEPANMPPADAGLFAANVGVLGVLWSSPTVCGGAPSLFVVEASVSLLEDTALADVEVWALRLICLLVEGSPLVLVREAPSAADDTSHAYALLNNAVSAAAMKRRTKYVPACFFDGENVDNEVLIMIETAR